MKESNGFLAVSYSNLVSPVIEAIKELLHRSDKQARRIASVENELAEVKEQNVEIKAQNAALKAYLCEKDPKARICK